MWLDLILLILGLALIIQGGDWFVSASVRIAEILRMPRVVIGSTLVSLATTSPELVVSIMSGFKRVPGLAVGNAVGSCICNIALIMGLTAALKHIEVHFLTLRRPLAVMFASGGALLVLTMDLTLVRWQGILILVLGLVYFYQDFIRHKRAVQPAEVAEARVIRAETMAGHPWLQTGAGTTVQFLAGAAVVVIGSKLLVESAVRVAAAMGIPNIIIGLTVVSVGTSLPELVTAVTSARKNVSDLAVGNIIGANIANLTLVVGAASSISDVSMSRLTQLFNFPALLLLMCLFLYTLFSDSRVSRRQGFLLLGFYLLYLSTLVGLTLAGKH